MMRRMDHWEKGLIAELVQETVAIAKRSLGGRVASDDDESIARRYHSMVIDGRLRAAVRQLTNRGGGGVMGIEDPDTKTGERVIDVLQKKHPDLMIPDLDQEGWASFETYDECPAPLPVDCTAETVEEIAYKLHGGAGPSSVDAKTMEKWLTRYGRQSQMLREELAAWTEWLANESPPWAAYRAVMSCRLVALDKCPGVRPLGIGEVWRRAMAKCVLVSCGEGAKSACGSVQLCAGVEAGIEAAMHAVKSRAEENETMEFGEWEVDDSIWEKEAEEGAVQDSLPERLAREQRAEGVNNLFTQEGMEDGPTAAKEEDILLLVDAANGFNMLSRLSMLWTVRHRCPKLARFAFNCYRHQIRLVCRRPGKLALILLSREGVTQGDPLSMALYGIALLPLAERLRAAAPSVMQPWYADDAAMMGPSNEVASTMMELIKIGPHFGYHPEPNKSFVICPLADQASAKAAFEAVGLDKISYVRGHRYVGGFVGSTSMKDRWLDPKVAGWVEGVRLLAKVAERYPQSAYAGFTQSLQAEWQYICRCVPGAEKHLEPVETAIRELFIPALLGISASAVVSDLRTLLGSGVKQGGLNIKNPVLGAARTHQASVEAGGTLVASLKAGSELDLELHQQTVRKAGAEARKERVDAEKKFLAELMAKASKAEKKRLERIGECGSWLTAVPNKLNGNVLTAEEWRDNARLRYGWRPIGLCERCDVCQVPLTVEHGLSCKKGGLVGLRHDDVADEAGELASLALTPSRVSYEPEIFSGKDVEAGQGCDGCAANPQSAGKKKSNVAGDEARGDVAVHGLWKRGQTCILDIRVTDTDAKSYSASTSAKVLEKAAKLKRDKYAKACNERRKSFTPLVYSVDGLACKEARAFERRVASLLATKWDRRYSEMVSFVRTRMSIALVRSNTLLLRGARRHGRSQRPVIEDEAALNAMDGMRES